MRALTRTRLLAALCVLMLLTFGSIARAGMPGRPIDRSGGPPDPTPVEVGDPDQPGGNITVTFTMFGRVYLFRVHWNRDLNRGRMITPWARPSPTRRGRHAG
jgi:hypothetical protein